MRVIRDCPIWRSCPVYLIGVDLASIWLVALLERIVRLEEAACGWRISLDTRGLFSSSTSTDSFPKHVSHDQRIIDLSIIFRGIEKASYCVGCVLSLSITYRGLFTMTSLVCLPHFPAYRSMPARPSLDGASTSPPMSPYASHRWQKR